MEHTTGDFFTIENVDIRRNVGVGLDDKYFNNFRCLVSIDQKVSTGDAIHKWGFIKVLNRSPVSRSPVKGIIRRICNVSSPVSSRVELVAIQVTDNLHKDTLDSYDVSYPAHFFFHELRRDAYAIATMSIPKRFFNMILGRIPG